MSTLFHHTICPLSRQIRIYLKELGEEFSMVQEEYWLRRKEFLSISPAGILPVITLNSDDVLATNEYKCLNIVGVYPITEYLAESNSNFYFMPKDLGIKSQVRNYLFWFNDKFYREVTKILVDEKMIRLLMRTGGPRTDFIKAAKSNLTHHFKFLTSILEKNLYITSEQISSADIAAAAHISVIDYFGEINWDNWPQIKHWYSIIKSRPSFRPLLQDLIAGFAPSKEYSNLDF